MLVGDATLEKSDGVVAADETAPNELVENKLLPAGKKIEENHTFNYTFLLRSAKTNKHTIRVVRDVRFANADIFKYGSNIRCTRYS